MKEREENIEFPRNNNKKRGKRIICKDTQLEDTTAHLN